MPNPTKLFFKFILISSLIIFNGCKGVIKVDVKNLKGSTAPILSSFVCVDDTLTEGDLLSCTAIGSDAEGNFGYRLSATNTCSGAVIDATTGIISMPADNRFVSTCTLDVEAFDGALSSASKSVILNVTNTIPTLTIADVTLNEDTVIIRSDAAVQASEGDYGVYSIDDTATTGTKCSSVGTLTINAVTGEVSLNALNWNGTCNATVKYDDQNGGVVSDQFSLIYTAVNDAPMASGTCPAALNQDANYNCNTLSAIDPEGDVFSWSLDATNTCSFLAIDSTTGVITGTPTDDNVGNCTLAYKTNDGTASNIYTRVVTVNNLVPTLSISPKSTGDSIGPVTLALAADVQASDEGFGVYSLDNIATTGNKCSDHGILSIDTATGEITFDGDNGYVGVCNVRVVFNDQNPTNNLVSTQFAFTITDTLAPIVQSVSSLNTNGTYNLGSLVSIQVTFNEAVFVTTTGGTPKILVDTGFVDREATYVSGSGSQSLTFNYTVQTDDSSLDLDLEVASPAIIAGGGVIEDTYGNTGAYNLPFGVNVNSLRSNKNIVVSGSYPFAALSNLPTNVSRTSRSDLIVGGTAVISYKYKWGLKNSTDCSVATGYSTERDISDRITENVTAILVGERVKFCVVGKNSSDVWQPYSAATTAEWTKGEYSLEPISLAGLTNLPNWKDVVIDSLGRIISRNARGEIFRSLDNGVTWSIQCKILIDNNALFKTDPGATGNTYVVSNGDIFKVEPFNGASCPEKTSTITDFNYTYYYAPMDIDSDGSLYLFIADAAGTRDLLYKSVDQGTNWTLINTLMGDGWSSSFAIDPNNKNKMIRFAADDVDNTRQGVYTSIDAGLTWVRTNTNDLTMVDIKYKNSAADTFYLHNGNYSTDAGTSILTSDGSIVANDMRRFSINNNGRGYFLQESGSTTLLRASADYGVATLSTLYTFNSAISNKNNQAISSRGSVIAAIAGGLFYISTDAGVTFTQVNWQGTKLALFTGIATKDGKTVYGVTSDWNIVKSNDVGDNWQLLYTYGNGCSGKEPRIDTHELNSNKISVWAGASYCNEYVTSIDGGVNFTSGKLALNDIRQSHSTDPINPNYEAFRSGTTHRRTVDNGNSFANESVNSVTNIGPDSYLDSSSGRKIWSMGNAQTNIFSTDLQAVSSSASIATGVTVAGLDAFVNDSEIFELRVISTTGQVRRSVDNGATFSNLGVAPGLGSCNSRYFYSSPQNRNVMASICTDGDDLTFTTNSGASWRTIDLDGLYGINCDAAGIAIHPNKIFVACKSYDVFYVKFNALELQNEASDSILSLADHALANPVISNTLATEFASSEYALIAAGGTCDNTLTFSSSIPLGTDAGFSASGFYEVCVKFTDASANVSFDRSPMIRYDASVPNAVSLSLTGALSDSILSKNEYMEQNGQIVTAITGSGYDKKSFAIIPSSSTCDGSHPFSPDIPIANLSNQKVQITDGTWKVCMELSDKANNGSSYASSSDFTFISTSPTAQLSNLPAYVSNVLNLNITVAGTGVVSYKYKLGYNTINCQDLTGYSTETAVGTPITDSLVAYKQTLLVNSSDLKICVIAKNAANNWQPAPEASQFRWSMYRYSMKKMALDQDSFVENWKTGMVDIHDSSIFYAADYTTMIYKSTNGGAAWTSLCQLPIGSNIISQTLLLRQSHLLDKTPYAIISGDVYKIENKEGADCTNLTLNVPNISFLNSSITNFQIGADGALFVVIHDSNEQRESIYKSTNGGLTWVRSGGWVAGENPFYVTLNLRADPFVAGRLYGTYTNPFGNRNDLLGIYRSDDSGKTWSRVQVTNNVYIYPSFQTPGKWSGVNVNTSAGVCTSDGWVTTTACTKFMNEATTFRHQTMTDEIYAYTSSSSANIMPTFTITKFGAGINSSASSVFNLPPIFNVPFFSIQGSSVLTAAKGRMHISTNAGASFTQIPPKNRSVYPLILGEVTENGKNILVSTGSEPSAKKVFISNNFGSSWSSLYDAQDGCVSQLYNPTGDMDFARFASFLSQCGRAKSLTNSYVTEGPIAFSDWRKVNDVGESETKFQFSTFFMAMTTNNWQSYEYKPFAIPYISPTVFFSLANEGFLDPRDDSRLFVLTLPISNVNYQHSLALIDYRAGTYVDYKANSNFPYVSGFGLTEDGLGGHYLYSMSNDGKIERSADYGLSFSVINNSALAGDDANTCRGSRSFWVDPKNLNNMQTSCSSNSRISSDGGLSFTSVKLSFQSSNNCNHVTKFFDGKNLYYQCDDGVGKIELSDFSLASGVDDGKLDSSEQAANTPLVSIVEPGYYSLIEYALVDASVVCDGSLTYTSVMPTTNDPGFTVSGRYKVCVKSDDGSLKYYETSPIVYTTGVPNFVSIALANDLADGILAQQEFIDSNKYIVSNLVASNYHLVEYEVTPAASTCSLLSNYKLHKPRSSLEGHSLSLINGDSYKVCIKLSNPSGVAYGASSNFVFTIDFPTATLVTPPIPVQKNTSYSSLVSGTNVTHYKYKYGRVDQSSCSSSAGYSVQTAIATPISLDLTAATVNKAYNLCIVGKNAANEWQPFSNASIYKFGIGTVKASFFKPLAIDGRVWVNVAIHATDPNYIALLSNSGDIYRSTDGGTNWTLLCTTEYHTYTNSTQTNLIIANDAQKTIYRSGSYFNGGTFRADDLKGSKCPQISSMASDVNSVGELFSLNNGNSGVTPTGVYRSLDKGKTWLQILSRSSSSNQNAFIINRNNDNNMLFLATNGTFAGAVTTDGGVTWTERASTGFNEAVPLISSPALNGSFFQPINNRFTRDNGATSEVLSGQLAFKNDGTAYRLRFVTSTSTILETNTDILNSSTWTSVYTFTNASFSNDGGQSYDSLVTSGNTIIAKIGGNLYFSTDAGVTFTKKVVNIDTFSFSSFDRSATKIFGSTSASTIFESADSGVTWSKTKELARNYTDLTSSLFVPNLSSGQMILFNSLFNLTNDSFATNTSTDGSADSNTCFFDNIIDPNNSMYSRSGTLVTTTDGFLTTSSSSEAVTISCSGDKKNAINPLDTNEIIFKNPANGITKYNTATNSSVILSSGLSSITDFEFYENAGTYFLRAIDAAGNIRVSTDLGSTFTTLGVANPFASYNLNSSKLVSEPTNRNFMVAFGAGRLHYTTDGAATWSSPIIFNDFQDVLKCDPKTMILFNDGAQKGLVSCNYFLGQTRALLLEF